MKLWFFCLKIRNYVICFVTMAIFYYIWQNYLKLVSFMPKILVYVNHLAFVLNSCSLNQERINEEYSITEIKSNYMTLNESATI